MQPNKPVIYFTGREEERRIEKRRKFGRRHTDGTPSKHVEKTAS